MIKKRHAVKTYLKRVETINFITRYYANMITQNRIDICEILFVFVVANTRVSATPGHCRVYTSVKLNIKKKNTWKINRWKRSRRSTHFQNVSKTFSKRYLRCTFSEFSGIANRGDRTVTTVGRTEVENVYWPFSRVARLRRRTEDEKPNIQHDFSVSFAKIFGLPRGVDGDGNGPPTGRALRRGPKFGALAVH